MLCGEVSQISNEIKTSSMLVQSVIVTPIVGVILLMLRNIYYSLKEKIKSMGRPFFKEPPNR